MSFNEAFIQGADQMKQQIIAALKRRHADDTAGDQCDRDTACAQCEDWYRAIETVEKVEVPK